jgi:hypothetical protein
MVWDSRKERQYAMFFGKGVAPPRYFSELAIEYSTYSRIIMQSQAFLHYFILKLEF